MIYFYNQFILKIGLTSTVKQPPKPFNTFHPAGIEIVSTECYSNTLNILYDNSIVINLEVT